MALTPVETGVLNVKYYEQQLLALLRNHVGGLRAYTNNKGIITGNQVRWPLVENHALATPVNKSAPIVANPVYSDTVEATIVQYEHVAKLDTFDLNSTNSAAELRASAAVQTANAIENRFTKAILDELANYDDVNLEVGDGTGAFNVDLFTDLNTKARIYNWPEMGRMLLLPPSAENTLMKDAKFYEIFSRYDGRMTANPGIPVGVANMNKIVFVPYRGWNIGFMGQVSSSNPVGLPATVATVDTGYAWVSTRVGFAMNQAITADVWQEKNLQGSPYLFKSIGSCTSKIIDSEGVIGIKTLEVSL